MTLSRLVGQWLGSIVLVVGVMAVVAQGCRIEMRVQSLTATPFKFQALIPSVKAVTETLEFNGTGGMKRVVVSV